MKTCSKCKIEKDESEFYKRADAKDGLCGQCKVCKNIVTRARGAANPEKFALARKRYRAKNPEKIALAHKRYSAKNPEKIKAKKRAWRENNPEREKERGRRWCAKNADKLREKRKQAADSLSDKYIAQRLSMRKDKVPQPLIELKREQLQMYRLTKQFNQLLKEKQNGTE